MRAINLLWPCFAILAAAAVISSAAPAPVAPPLAFTQPAIAVTSANAVLTGMATPNGKATTAWFQWGYDTNYGNVTLPINAGNGAGVVHVDSETITLNGAGSYHFQLVASNSDGVVYGTDQVFGVGKTIWVWGNSYSGQDNPPSGLNSVEQLAGGGAHSLALTTTGNVVAWGNNLYGQATVPGSLANATMTIAGGYYHSLAVTTNGQVVAWGNNFYKQTNVPAGLANVIAVAAGYYDSMALTADGHVVAWGQNSFGQTNVPAAATNIVAIAAGGNHNLALRNDGTIIGWGDNSGGQLNVPGGLNGVVALAAGGLHSFALLSNGTVVGWGDDSVGQIDVPAGLTGVTAIASGENHGLALTANGAVTGWGYDFYGQIDAPSSAVNLLSIAGGGDKSLGLSLTAPPSTTANTLPAVTVPSIGEIDFTLRGLANPNGLGSVAWFEWGTDPTYGNTTPSQSIGAGGQVVFVSSGITNLVATLSYHCHLVVSNRAGLTYGADQIFGAGKKVVAWGDNSLAQVSGNPNNNGVVAVGAGSYHSLEIEAGGTGTGWGDNSMGQSTIDPSTAFGQLAGGDFHTVGLAADGTLAGYGDDSYGQTEVPAATNFISVAAGSYHNLALDANGMVTAWGADFYGQATVPTNLANVVAVAAGFAHSMALKDDGTVVCWGDNTYGQTTVPPQARGVIAIAAGDDFCLALRSDGTVVGWGDNLAGQISIPGAAVNVVAIAAGGAHALALTAGDQMIAWGYDNAGQTDVPAGLENIIAIAGGEKHSLAICGSSSPLAIAQTITSPAGINLKITLSGTDADGAALSSIVTSLPAFGHLYQYVAGSRGLAILDTYTPVSDPGGQIIFVPDAGGQGTPYASFQFVVTDGISISTPATITINVASGGPVISNGVPAAPFAMTETPAPITATNAVLNGMASANFTPTSAWFEWGLTTNYAYRTPTVSVSTNSGVVFLRQTITNLVATLPYHFRLVVSNGLGVAGGADQVFGVGRNLYAWGDKTFGETNVPGDLPKNATSLAAGYFHSLAVRLDGTGEAWGDNSAGQTVIPTGSNSLVQLAGGDLHTVALFADGTVQAVGDNTYGQTSVPVGLSGIVSIASGGYHTLALSANGTVAAWGANHAGQINVPGVNNIVAIAAGFAHSMALRNDGTLFIWGDNTYGQQNVPASATNLVAIAAGRNSCLGLRKNGTVIGWGDNAANQLTVPANVTNIMAIAAGNSHFMALRRDGRIFAWGLNNSGQTNAPTNSSFIGIAAGEYHSLAMSSDTAPVAINQVTNVSPTNFFVTLVLTGTDADPGDFLSFSISSIPAYGTLYQYNPTTGNRGPAILGTNVPVTDGAGRVIFVPDPGAYGAPYTTFQFTASDGVYNSQPGTVTINIPGKPNVVTLLPVIFNGTNVTLNGSISSDLSNSAAYFQWGLTTNYGSNTLVTNVGASAINLAVPTNVIGLTIAQTYHYRIVGTNSFGTNFGADVSFTVPVSSVALVQQATVPATTGYKFAFSGNSNATYSVWASTNLVDWDRLGSAAQPTPGHFLYQDAAATNYPARFYKVVWP